MVSWLQNCVSAFAWGSHEIVAYPCHHGFFPGGEYLFVGKRPSLFVTVINIAVVMVHVLFHCFVLSRNRYLNP